MLSFIKNKLQKIYNSVTSHISYLFSAQQIDDKTLQELETILLSADTGIKTTKKIINHLKEQWKAGFIKGGSDLKKTLEAQLLSILQNTKKPTESSVYVLVGINGSGKTTFASKLAYSLKKQGKRVLLVAADTFRAAATQQLTEWSHKIGVEIVSGQQGQDPAAVVFQGCEKYKREQFDALIIDTAGRLQTKINLMKELEKIKRNISRHLPDQPINTLLTVDAMLGQNSFEQARLFHESTDLQGIVLTKMDGTGKGGIVFAIVQELEIPLIYISYGEHLDALKPFDAQEYVAELLSTTHSSS
jgi:fused signal recognition particle receptor